MGHKAHTRIIAAFTAIIITLSGSIYYNQYHVSASVPDGAGLGFSGERPGASQGPGTDIQEENPPDRNDSDETGGPGEDSEQDSSPDSVSPGEEENNEDEIASETTSLALGTSAVAFAAPVYVSTFQELKDVVTAATDAHIVLNDNITMTGAIAVPASASIEIDGQGQYAIRQTSNGLFNFQLRSGAFLKLRNMDVTIVNVNGIAQCNSASASDTTLHIENVNFNGTQLFYNNGANRAKVIITGCEIDIEKTNSTNPQEMVEAAYLVFDGGTTNIRHRLADNAIEIWSIFWMKGDTGGENAYMQVTGGAQVTIATRNYIWYPVQVSGNGNVIIDDGCSLDMTAPAMLQSTGSTFQIKSITVGENATFKFTQSGTSRCSTTPRLIIKGDVTVKPGGVFDYHNMRDVSGSGFEIGGTFRADSPKRISIYCQTTAFYSVPKVDITGVNAINFWTDAASANPDYDSAAFLPQYMWNYEAVDPVTGNVWFDGQQTMSFSGLGSNLSVSGPEAYDRVKGAPLSSTLKFDKTAKRINMGHVDATLEMEPTVSISRDSIPGTASTADVAAHYVDLNDQDVIISSTSSFPIPYGSAARPKPETDVLAVGVWDRIRVGVNTKALGTLELVSAPTLLDYGISTLPTTTTLYKRASCDNVTPDGKMLVEVVDARGSDSTDWTLCLQMDVLGGKQPLPDGSLVFLDGADKHTVTYGTSAPVYSGHKNTAYADYTLSWGDNQGLLAEIAPGTTQAGVYASILDWSLQTVP